MLILLIISLTSCLRVQIRTGSVKDYLLSSFCLPTSTLLAPPQLTCFLFEFYS